MGIVIRQGIKGTVVNYLGAAIGAFNFLYLFPKFLAPEEIGLTRVLLDLSLMLAGIAQIGMSGIIDKFFPYYKNEEKKHNGFFLFVLVYPLIGFTIIVLLFLFLKGYWISLYQSKSKLLIHYYYYLIPLVFVNLYLLVLEAYSRAHLRIVVPIFFKEIYLRIFISLIAVLYYFKTISLDTFVLMIIASYASAVIFVLYYINVLKKFFLITFSLTENKSRLKDIFKFSLTIVASGTVGLIASKIDVILLSSFAGLSVTGVYAIAFYIGTIIEIPRRSLSQISVPFIASAWKSGDIRGMEKIYARLAVNQFIIGLLLFLVIWVNVDAILSLIPNSEQYQKGKYVIFLIGLSRLVDMFTGVNAEIINTSPFYRINFVLTFLSGIISIALNNLLIPSLGMIGAGLSTFIAYSSFNGLRIIYIWRKIRIQPFSMNHLKIFFVGVSVFGVAYFLQFFFLSNVNTFFKIGINSFLIFSLFIPSLYLLKVSEDFNMLTNKLLKYLKR